MRTEASVSTVAALAATIACGWVLAADSDTATITRYVDENTDRVPLHTVAPAYPRVARRDRVEGVVQVCYHIDRKGRPYRIAVRHSTHRMFERPAIRAVRASTYKPLAAEEETPAIKACRTFRFELAPAVADDADG